MKTLSGSMNTINDLASKIYDNLSIKHKEI